MALKSILRTAVRFGIRCIDTSPRLRRLVDNEICSIRDWRELDHLYTVCRRRLNGHPEWRFGPRRTGDIAAFILEELSRWGSLTGKVYCDLGCGTLNPYGTAAFVYLNGADATWSIDVSPVTNPQRAAEALFDLLVDCVVRPDFWHRSDLPREEYLRRWQRFDMAKLREGDLAGGIAGLPFRHVVGDIRNGLIPDGSVHLLSSEAVVEHLDDLPVAAARLYALMAPGGVAAHNVDVRDHRIYSAPDRFHAWSFMEEEGDSALKSCECNGLRCGEVISCFEQSGFKVHDVNRIRDVLPAGLKDRLRGRYAGMPDEELETVGFTCVMSRPVPAAETKR